MTNIVSAITRQPLRARILLHHLSGSMDAGSAGRLALQQLVPSLPHERVATFNADALVDWRARRPVITLDSWAITEVEAPEIALEKVTDYSGEDILILHGVEPDLRWDEFSDIVTQIATEAGVETSITMFGLPAATPHTRPPIITQTSSTPGTLPPQEPDPGVVQFSASIGSYLQSKLGKAGINALGLAVGVPYYVMESDYPAAAAALISRISDLTGLELPIGDLEAAAATMSQKLGAEVNSSEEIETIIHGLEERVDALPLPEVTAAPTPIPTGEELAARFESFLRTNADVETDTPKNDLMPPPTNSERGRHRGTGPVDGPSQT
ncbi:MAG: PAC2 family protein [Actinomycetaceae bacterium]|nr:PAC2 family protein [Actinomycetaceae bacterium]